MAGGSASRPRSRSAASPPSRRTGSAATKNASSATAGRPRRRARLPLGVLLILALAQGAALALLLHRLLPGRRRRPPVAPGGVVPAGTSVSVVVASLNEAHRIQPCLDGLVAQDVLVREILVVDSGSTDGTAELVRAA